LSQPLRAELRPALAEMLDPLPGLCLAELRRARPGRRSRWNPCLRAPSALTVAIRVYGALPATTPAALPRGFVQRGSLPRKAGSFVFVTYGPTEEAEAREAGEAGSR